MFRLLSSRLLPLHCPLRLKFLASIHLGCQSLLTCTCKKLTCLTARMKRMGRGGGVVVSARHSRFSTFTNSTRTLLEHPRDHRQSACHHTRVERVHSSDMRRNSRRSVCCLISTLVLVTFFTSTFAWRAVNLFPEIDALVFDDDAANINSRLVTASSIVDWFASPSLALLSVFLFPLLNTQ